MANKRITDRGRQYLLDLATGITAGGVDVDYRLFQSNITPTQDDTDGTYAGSDATFSGYAAQQIVGWGASTVVGETRQSLATPVTYTVSASPGTTNNIYGYYAVIHGTAHVVWAMRFDGAPLAMDAGGKAIEITPALTSGSQFS